MLFQDKSGKLYLPDEIDEFSEWELEDKELHVVDEW